MIAITRRYADMTRREKFMVILGAIALLTLLFSVIARVMVFEPDNERPIKLAMLAPMTGEQAFLGQSLQQGAQLYVDEVNKQGGIKGRVLQLEILDDKGRIEDARPLVEELASSNEWAAVIGHGQPDITRELSLLYAQQSLPLVSTVSLSEGLVGSSPWLYSTMPNLGKQTRFLANYSLNVLGQTVVSIVSDGSEEGAFAAQTFSETYKIFKTKTNYRWDFDRNDPNLIEKLKEIADDIRSKVDTGAVFLAVDSVNAARLIKYIRDTGARNNLIGLASLATQSFNKTLDGMIEDQSGEQSDAPAKAPKSKADYLDGLTLTSPLMFDTAGEDIQNFKNAYIDRFEESPDWMSAHAYSAASMLGESLKKILSADARISGIELRQAVLSALKAIKLNPDEEN